MLVRGVEWLVELCEGEQLMGMDVRQVVKSIEDKLVKAKEETPYSITVVLEYRGKTITADMVKDPHSLTMEIPKE